MRRKKEMQRNRAETMRAATMVMVAFFVVVDVVVAAVTMNFGPSSSDDHD